MDASNAVSGLMLIAAGILLLTDVVRARPLVDVGPLVEMVPTPPPYGQSLGAFQMSPSQQVDCFGLEVLSWILVWSNWFWFWSNSLTYWKFQEINTWNFIYSVNFQSIQDT